MELSLAYQLGQGHEDHWGGDSNGTDTKILGMKPRVFLVHQHIYIHKISSH